MWRRSKPSLPEVILFWNYLKHFLGAGLPLVLAFQRLTMILVSHPWPALLQRIEFSLLSGETFSQALVCEQENFDRDVIEMITIAEKKGNYPEVIALIVDHLKWQLHTKKSVMSALRYPCILMIILSLIFYLILQHIVPQLQGYLGALGNQELPFSTYLLLRVSQSAPYFFGGLSGVGVFIVICFKSKSFLVHKPRQFFEKYSLRIPIVGRLYDRLIIIHFIRMLAILMESGVDILVSLHQSIKIVPNAWVAEQLEKGKHRLIQGEKLSIALKEVLIYHPALILLLDLGEQTGQLPRILQEYVSFEMAQFKSDVEQRIQGLQPFLILLTGGLLIWVVLAILLPMYDQIGKGV